MNRCKNCVMPDTRPGIQFNEEGICYPCLNAEKKRNINWKTRQDVLRNLCDRYRRNDGRYDCIIPMSGGKDSIFQVHVMKDIYKMNPLLVCVSDSFTHTEAGKHNLRIVSEVFGCDLITYNLNHKTLRKMVRIAFEELGSPTWAVDMAIYSVPLKIAAALDIPLVIYGENIAYEYGGPNARETYSAKEQIKNDVVKEVDWNLWYDKGITKEELEMIRYPDAKIVDKLEPIYLSYFYPWDGRKNYELAKKFGFRDLEHEWHREGYIEHYDQIDSIGYLINPWFKYLKYGHARATDVACYWIRNGYISRGYGMKLVREHDHKLDQKTLDDFLDFTGYTDKEFWDLAEKFYNKELFEHKDGKWILKRY